MTTKLCKTCRHWKSLPYEGWSQCLEIIQDDVRYRGTDVPAQIEYRYPEFSDDDAGIAEFYTHETFGCVLWNPKP